MPKLDPFRKSFQILHSALSLVFLFFIFDSTIFFTLFNRIALLSLPGKIFFAVLIPIRVCLCAGAYGLLVEIVSGDQRLIKLQRWEENARQFWKLFWLLATVPYLIQLFFRISFPDVRIPFSVIAAHVDFLLVFLLSQEIIRKKYASLLSKNTRVQLSPRVFFNVLLLFCGGLLVSYIPVIFDRPDGDLSRVTTFLSKYFLLWEFLYFTALLIEQHEKLAKNFFYEKELILINPAAPGAWTNIPFSLIRMRPPLFVVLRALTPKSYHVREFNRVVWHDRYYDTGKLVAISCFTSNSPEAYKIAKEFRRRGSKVVMGGPHVNFLPDEALAFCDSVVIGEAESAWKQVVQDYENGCLQKKYIGEARDDYYVEVHKELLASPVEVTRDFLELTRGCKYSCHFCTIPAITQRRIRKKPIPLLVELIEKVRPTEKTVMFLDNNIYADPVYTKEFFKVLKTLKIKWATQCSIDMAKDDEMVALAKESGCQYLLIGYEISDHSAEQDRGGKFANAKRYLELSRKLKKAGIGIKAHFIFGFDSDDFRGLWDLWKLCWNIFPTFTVISLLTPFPGAGVYYQMLKEDRLLTLSWRNFSMFGLVYQPKKMNRVALAYSFPFIFVIFLLTTCRTGYLVIVALILQHHMEKIFIAGSYK